MDFQVELSFFSNVSPCIYGYFEESQFVIVLWHTADVHFIKHILLNKQKEN